MDIPLLDLRIIHALTMPMLDQVFSSCCWVSVKNSLINYGTFLFVFMYFYVTLIAYVCVYLVMVTTSEALVHNKHYTCQKDLPDKFT